MRVPFVDLKRQGEELGSEYLAVFGSILDRAAFTLGPEVAEFETKFASFCGATHCVGVSSGTDAVKIALRVAGVGPGDEVVVPVNTFIATAEAVTQLGARPVFVDCVADTANIEPGLIDSGVTGATRAVVPVHLFGQPADMAPVVESAVRHRLAVVEDACQAHGAEYRGRRVGSLGDVAAFSFYPGKNLGALGDGGAVTMSQDGMAESARLLRNHGQADKYTHALAGYCDRLHNLQAGFLLVKLCRIEEWNAARRAAAAVYDELLAGIDGIEPIRCRDDVLPVYHLYVVEVEDRDRVREELQDAGIETGIHYPVPLHLQPAYADLGYAKGDFPVAERLAARILSLPMFPEISPRQQEYVVEHLGRVIGA